ncbi:MAG: hypothetical protein R2705_08030 [Ilumatobacteraceae bacterium]
MTEPLAPPTSMAPPVPPATPSGGSGRQKLGIAMVVVSLLAAAGIWAAQRAAFAGSVKNLALEQDPG